MTRRLTPAERLAGEARDKTLADILEDTQQWDVNVAKRAIIAHGKTLETFSANDFRDALPEQGSGLIGAACRGLSRSGILIPTGEYVPSTSERTKGHRIAVYRMNLAALRGEAA